MTFDSRGEHGELPEAEGGFPGSDPARSAARGTGGHRRPGPVLVANDEELVVAGADVALVRSALAELGAHGSSSLDGFSPEATIALLGGLQKLSDAVAAVQARALVHLEESVTADSRRRGETPKQARKIAHAEASMALKRSTSAAGQTMSSGRRLVRSMPGMLAALAEGRVVAAVGHRVGTVMGPATPEQREQVDEILTAHLGYLEDCGPEEWGDEAERVLHALDPDGAAARHQVAARERSVTVRRGRHGMATLTAHLTGLDGARIRKGLSVAAEKARAGGDRRGHQQIMADLLADALIGRGDGVDPSTLDIGVIMTDRSLLAPAHADAATVEGYGSVPYEHIRQEMLKALEAEGDPDLALTLRTFYADSEDGQLVAVESRARQFPPGLARLLRAAHQTCRAPHCDAGIRQMDHIVPWSEGGETSLQNGNGLCAADNQKEEAGQRARVITDEDGVRRTVEWTTRYGQRARRRGRNFDPVGTASRGGQQERDRQRERRRQREGPGQREEGSRLEAQQARGVTSPRMAKPELDHTVDDIGASLHSAFARIDPEAFAHLDLHPAAHRSRRTEHWLRRRRVDIFLPRFRTVSGGGPPGSAESGRAGT